MPLLSVWDGLLVRKKMSLDVELPEFGFTALLIYSRYSYGELRYKVDTLTGCCF